jgi:hypothetical protein
MGVGYNIVLHIYYQECSIRTISEISYMTTLGHKGYIREMALRSFYSVLSDDVGETRDWFVGLFDYQVEFDNNWFVHLQPPNAPGVELGILLRTHETVPEAFRGQPMGGILTIVVDDVDSFYEEVISDGTNVIEPPRDLFYGQRRMLIADPNGLMIDVSSECEPDPEWLATLGG